MNPASNWFCAFILFLLAVTICQLPNVRAYTFIKPNAQSPDLEGHCYYDAYKLSLPVNQTRQTPDRCEEVSCFENYSIQVIGCSIISVGPGYKLIEGDNTKPFPHCCPTAVKNEENIQ